MRWTCLESERAASPSHGCPGAQLFTQARGSEFTVPPTATAGPSVAHAGASDWGQSRRETQPSSLTHTLSPERIHAEGSLGCDTVCDAVADHLVEPVLGREVGARHVEELIQLPDVCRAARGVRMTTRV
jgi:hypothetical protein